MKPSILLPSLFLVPSLALPSPQQSDSLTSVPDATSTSSAATSTCTGNTADDRTVWCDYDISTDYYSEGPDTGVTREYWFDLQNGTASLDGVEKIVLTVNGSFPGPTIYADWGDEVVVHVTNSLENNGTGIHWHGIRQNYTAQHDGVPSISQCPLAPGESMTYKWKATQYGSSWYHSHFALQAWDGVLGGIVINGPATANYDVDLGPMFLNDWWHEGATALYYTAETDGPPTLDNGLINGTNVYTTDDSETVGERWSTTFESGKKYRFRLVNAAIDSHFKFMIDNHNLTVIAMDLVPIEPYVTTVLDIAMGQRYDIIVEANQDTADYWLRAIPQSACSENDNEDNIKGIIRYDSTSTSDPTTSAYDYTDECVDEPAESLVPYVSKTVGSSTDSSDDLNVAVSSVNSLFKWRIGSTTMAVEWADPTILQIWNNETGWESSDAVHELNGTDEWVAFVIETTQPVPHPIHLHGHDFFLLASEASATYDESTVTLNTTNPVRRDTINLPASGYIVVAFQTDNPGAWLMHCHIGWHTSEGLALQFVERKDDFESLIDYDTMNDVCSAWSTYQEESGVEEDDSGI